MNLKKNLRENWSAVALVVLTTVLTYGVFIPQLGFYRDDWYTAIPDIYLCTPSQ